MARTTKVAVLLVIAAFAPAAVAAKTTPPNILFVALDDLVWLDTPSGNHGSVVTPGFDALAMDSLTLANAIVQHPICTASRGSIMLGRRPDTTRLYDFSTSSYANGGSCKNCLTIPELFRTEGYWTMNAGKVFHAWHDGRGGHPNAWDEVNPYCGEKKDRSHQAINLSATGLEDFPCDLQILKYAQRALKDRATTAESARPWFMGVGFTMSHLPWVAPAKLYEIHPLENVHVPLNYDVCTRDAPLAGSRQISKEFKAYPSDKVVETPCGDSSSGKGINRSLAREYIQAYRVSVSYSDYAIGVLVKDLKKWNFWNNTVIILWSDHGYKLGEHHLWHKDTLHRESTKAPLMLRVPGITDGGQISHSLIEHVDIMATLVDAAGLQPVALCPDAKKGGAPWNVTRCTEGTSFFSLATSNAAAAAAAANSTTSHALFKEKRAAFSQVYTGQGADAIMGYSMTTANDLRFTAWVHFLQDASPSEWINREWTLEARIGGFELYNHTVDPYENENIASSNPILVSRLYDELRSGWRESSRNLSAVLLPSKSNLNSLPWFCGSIGCFPQTWILGGQKCGSTSLNKLLITHYSTCGATFDKAAYEGWTNASLGRSFFSKETHILQSSEVTPRALTALYPRSQRASCTNGFVEATPYNLYGFKVPGVLAKLLPTMEHRNSLRFAVVLREPIARDISSYNHQKRDGITWGVRTEFPRCVASEHEIYDSYAACELRSYYLVLESSNSSAAEAPKTACGSVLHETLSRKVDLYRGMFAPQLELWFEHFSRDQVFVIAMDALVAETAAVLPRLTRFLRFQTSLQQHVELPHANAARTNGAPLVSCKIRDALSKVYDPFNRRLYSILELPAYQGSKRPQDEGSFEHFLQIQCSP